MKKLAFDSSNWKLIGTINDLIDLVNSQQEAIEKLESKVWTAGFIEKYRPALENLAEADDTHRTVTLRIPKDWRIGQTIANAMREINPKSDCDPYYVTDTYLQATIDKITKEKK